VLQIAPRQEDRMETVKMSREEIEARTGRFAALQPMEFMKNDTAVSQAAKDIILARKLMPVLLERTQSAFGNDAPIYNAAGLTMFISIMPPGQGPCLHAHVKTFETFIVLEGKLEFSLNDDGSEKIVLNRWDTFSCPPGVNRGFRNVDTKDSVLLTLITGGINDRNDIGLPPAIAKQIEAVDPHALEVFKTKMGLRFDAGPEV
jgi:quercetin dioxygenase-like cupin family protein